MEGSGESSSECSKTWAYSKNSVEEEEEDEEEKLQKDGGGSSSNSTVEESEKKSSSTVRPYVRSKMPRLRWTPDLHLRFVHAVERLGGQDRATPKLVLQLMNIKGLNIAHVKSHLQMFRSKKIDDHGQGIGGDHHHSHVFEGSDRNVFNLRQLPMFPGFNQNHNPTFRYGDAYWKGLRNLMHDNTTMKHKMMRPGPGPGFYEALTGKILGNNYYYGPRITNSSTTQPPYSWQRDNDIELIKPSKELEKTRFSIDQDVRTSSNNISSSTTTPRKQEDGGVIIIHQNVGKRKASLYSNELDLNLSLGLQNGDDDEEEEEDMNGDLSLSLCSPSSTKLIKRLKEDTMAEENHVMKRASTLDLTL